MARLLTWLHLSDLHLCKPRTGWEATYILESLQRDFKHMESEHDLHPDLIFFTGDAAYGHLGRENGLSITEQFRRLLYSLIAFVWHFLPQFHPKTFLLYLAITM